MKQCHACGNILEDVAVFCNKCGAKIDETMGMGQDNIANSTEFQNEYQNGQTYYMQQPNYFQQQMYMNQQFVEQQRMLNTMMEQQQYMNQRIEKQSNQQQQYIYVPTKVTTEFSLRNSCALVAAICCVISLFTNIISGINMTITDISSFSADIIDYCEDWQWLAAMLAIIYPWVVGGLALTLFIGAFFTKAGQIKALLELIHFFCMISMISIIGEIWSHLEISDLGIGMLFLAGSWILSLVSTHTDSGPRDTSVLAPRRSVVNGGDSNARSVESMARDRDIGRWVCPKCDAKNTGSVCKVCGAVRR